MNAAALITSPWANSLARAPSTRLSLPLSEDLEKTLIIHGDYPPADHSHESVDVCVHAEDLPRFQSRTI